MLISAGKLMNTRLARQIRSQTKSAPRIFHWGKEEAEPEGIGQFAFDFKKCYKIHVVSTTAP